MSELPASFFRIRSLTISQGTREAANGPEYLVMKECGNWPVDDDGNSTDDEWIRNHIAFAAKFGVQLDRPVEETTVQISVWYSSGTTQPNGSGPIQEGSDLVHGGGECGPAPVQDVHSDSDD